MHQVPPPLGDAREKLQALIFDCHYDPYKGVVAYIRVVNGAITAPAPLYAMSGDKRIDPIEIGILTPAPVKASRLTAGEVGYIATGLKSVQDLDVGDTITLAADPAPEPLPGYEPMKPMVFAGLYPDRLR